MKKLFFYSPLLITLFFCCKNNDNNDIENNEIQKQRTINFAGYEWLVDNSGTEKRGPGPNFFSDSDENVWLDSLGYLHLKITYKNGNWYCAKVYLKESYGYNKYVFYLDSRIDNLDENMVVGLFTYENDTAEIDIEFSKWGDCDKLNSQYAIQPSYKPENKERFDIQYDSNLSTIHSFDWKAEEITFLSLFNTEDGTNPDSDTIHYWKYTGKNIPFDKNERLKINLWLFRGNPPTGNFAQEIVIKILKYFNPFEITISRIIIFYGLLFHIITFTHIL